MKDVAGDTSTRMREQALSLHSHRSLSRSLSALYLSVQVLPAGLIALWKKETAGLRRTVTLSARPCPPCHMSLSRSWTGQQPTSVDNPLLVQVCNSTADGADQMGGIMFIVVALSADPVERLSALSQFGHQVHFGSEKKEKNICKCLLLPQRSIR